MMQRGAQIIKDGKIQELKKRTTQASTFVRKSELKKRKTTMPAKVEGDLSGLTVVEKRKLREEEVTEEEEM